MAIRVLVVDDTVFYRKIISDILASLPQVEVVGTANNGKIALSRIKALEPDLVTLDVEMPVLDGLGVLKEIQELGLDVDCLMLSAITQKGSEVTMQALELGAFDFVTKPEKGTAEENTKALQAALAPLLRGYVRRKEMKTILSGRPVAGRSEDEVHKIREEANLQKRTPAVAKRTEHSVAVAIGVSTGGPNALAKLIPALPAKIGVPILVVQHMPAVFTGSLAKSLSLKSRLTVKEAVNGETIKPDIVYIAPGGMQMKVSRGAGGERVVRIMDDPPENNCKPSVDYLFRSVAREYSSKVTSVIMTGMGSDGKLGVKVIKAKGGICIAQNASTCVVYGMPKAVIDAELADVIAPLDQIDKEIMKTLAVSG